MEFTVYTVEGDSTKYITLDDAQKIFDILIGINLEKHRIVGISNFQLDPEYGMKRIAEYSHSVEYTSYIENSQLKQTIYITMQHVDNTYTEIRLTGIQNIVSADYSNNGVLGATVVSELPGVVKNTVPYSLTFYYTER